VRDDSASRGWEISRFDSVAKVISGKNQKDVENSLGPYPIYGSGGVFGKSTAYLCEAGTTVVGRKGTINSPIFVNERFWNVDTAFGLSPISSDSLLPLFLFYFCQGFNFTKLDKSTTIPSLAKRDIEAIEFPLPPLAEQKRIVAKIEELFSELDAGEESLRVARRQLGVYRQSLLKQAFEGKLTEKWRTANPDKFESPATLLARIQSARQSNYDQQIKEWANSETDKRRPRKLKESAPLTSDELSDLPELPDCWKWVHPDALVSHEPYSLGIGPFGSNLKVSDYTESGVPLVFVKNITRNDFSLEPRFVSEAKAKELSAHTTIAGDLLITKMGDPPGDCAIYPLGSPEAVITADCLKFRLFVDYCARGFYGAFINSMVCRKQFGFITRGVAQKKISVERFKSIALPLCSLPEQQEIVRLLDEQFEVIERNEREIDAALRRSEALRQAILKKAFTGQLVAQDPADEPASVLLARLQAGRQESVAIKSQSVKKARTRRTTPG
jgi:type I restriction enzyme S subunit